MLASRLLYRASCNGSPLDEIAVHACVGVIRNPSRGIIQGEPEWSCKLLLTECGSSARWPPTASTVAAQQVFQLRCRGVAMAGYCLANLKEGEMIHVVSKLIHKPRYVPVHGTYFTTTELLVTDSLGSITSVAQLR